MPTADEQRVLDLQEAIDKAEHPEKDEQDPQYAGAIAAAREKIPALKAEYESLLQAHPELQAFSSSHPATEYEIRRAGISMFGGSALQDVQVNHAYIPSTDKQKLNLLRTRAAENPNATISELRALYESNPLPQGNTQTDYAATLAARQAGYNVGSGIPSGLAETFQKDWDKRFGEHNKIINLYEGKAPTPAGEAVKQSYGKASSGYDPLTGTVTPQNPRRKTTSEGNASKLINEQLERNRSINKRQAGTIINEKGEAVENPLYNTDYTISLTEGAPVLGDQPKQLAVSLSEGKPNAPKQYTQEQVNKLSEKDYAVYKSEFAPYNQYVKEKAKADKLAAKEESLSNWNKYKTDLLSTISEAKGEGVNAVTIKSDTGFQTVGIDQAFLAVLKSKNVTSIAPVENIPEGYFLAGSLSEPVLFQEDKQTYGPDRPYTGIFQNPSTSKKDELTDITQRFVNTAQDITKSPFERFYAGMAQTGASLLGGIVNVGSGIKGYADLIAGNFTGGNMSQSETSQQVESLPLSPGLSTSQKAAAVHGGGLETMGRNVGTLQKSLDQIVEADFKSRREPIQIGENPILFGLKEQQKQSALKNYLDVREGVTTGLNRFGESFFVIPEAVYNIAKTGDYKAGENTLEKHFAELDKSLGPSAPGAFMAGQGTGRSPYYNIGESVGEILPMFLPLKGSKGKLAPERPLSPMTKARLLVKSQAGENIFGIERFKGVKNQFMGFIGLEEKPNEFKPLSRGTDYTKQKVTPAKPDITAIGPKGEKITIKTPEAREPFKGEPSKTPALVIDTEQGGLTGIIRSEPKPQIKNQIGVIIRGDVDKVTAKRLGLKKIETGEKVPTYVTRIPKGTKKQLEFYGRLEAAEKLGAITHVTDVDFIPTETALDIQGGRTPYGKTEIQNAFKTAPYYETKNLGLERVRENIKGINQGSVGFDKYLRQIGLETLLEPKGEKIKLRPFTGETKPEKGIAGSGGKAQGITQEKAVEIANVVKDIVGTKAQPREDLTSGVAAYGASGSFETESGRYTLHKPIEIHHRRLDMGVTQRPEISQALGSASRTDSLIRESLVQPSAQMEKIQYRNITKEGIKEAEKERSRLAEKLVFKDTTKQTSREALRLGESQRLAEVLVQKPLEKTMQKMPEPLKPKQRPRFKEVPFAVPEIKKLKKERILKEKKEGIEFLGNTNIEKVTGFRTAKTDISYGKRVQKLERENISSTRRELGTKSFVKTSERAMLHKSKPGILEKRKPFKKDSKPFQMKRVKF